MPTAELDGADFLLLALKFGGMDVWEAKKLRELERENTELKKRIAELSLDVRMPKDVNSKQWWTWRRSDAAQSTLRPITT